MFPDSGSAKPNYWRQLFMLLFFVLGGFLLSVVFAVALQYAIWGKQIISTDFTNPQVIYAMWVTMIFSQLGSFLLPVWIFIKLSFQKPLDYLRLRNKPQAGLLAAIVLLFIIQLPLISGLAVLNDHIHLPDFLHGLEEKLRAMDQTDATIEALFSVNTSVWGILLSVFVVCLLPAFCEEFLFRGTLGRIFKDWSHSTVKAALAAGIIFSLAHFSYGGFLPRMYMGVVLTLLYLWSDNLWYSIAAHFTNNFLSLMALLAKNWGYNVEDKSVEQHPLFWIAVAASLAVSVYILYWFYQKSRKVKLKPLDL